MADHITSLQRNRSLIFALSRFFKYKPKDSDTEVYQLMAPDPIFSHHAQVNLGCATPPSMDQLSEWTPEARLAETVDYDGYEDSEVWFVEKILEEISMRLFDVTDVQRMTRTTPPYPFITKKIAPPERTVLLDIPRAGTNPTAIARKWLRRKFNFHAPVLVACTERQGTLADMKAVAMLKGVANLNGSTLVIMETAVATTASLNEDIRGEILKCKSVPDRVIVGCLNTTEESLRRLQNLAKPEDPPDHPIRTLRVDVVAAILHTEMNGKGYLIPGPGDAGRMKSRLPDE